MRNLILVGAAVLLAACSVLPAPRSPAETLYDLRAAYDAAVLAPAASYAQLPTCGAAGAGVVCSEPAALAEIRQADKAVLTALDTAEGLVRTHPQADASMALDAARAAIGAAEKILALYGVK